MDEEKFNLENFPSSASANKMLSYVSEGFYDASYVGKWLYQVMGMEYDSAREIVESLPAQFFIETATWGLAYHEIKWQLPVRNNLPDEERRKLIYQKRDSRAPMTPYRIELCLKNATGFDVVVADCHDAGPYDFQPDHPNIFKVYLSGEGTLDVATVKQMIQRLKQSHTAYIINDYSIFEIDNRGVEQMRLREISMAAKIPFLQLLGPEIKATVTIDMPARSILEAFGNATVTYRKNSLFFDGTIYFDGEKTFDSLSKKEDI